ncbi:MULTISPECIES: TetR/AcrR family transcriptional regulator [Pseudonocardia]|uniref:Bacterial regulatory protein n=2 Tax=Pseudonocardia TaxID=1847 RepID=A0A1Y2N231_PSEAH|nr:MULTISPECIES: helix-turn-helix domain-containing protein [Pseudonocardia]OSY41525.1 Bacterial regulatory protein [Pseudonocardia autotrophica]TDN71480.1 TetR family transcriptional regulator [Pseudonocardia autotrophica]BBG02156.1 TetR family transcriptional regulator [Pseudonocardia autotrophica]GEC24170.1 TetR family transcriptional regulator [Pseudonocardia saturnea]
MPRHKLLSDSEVLDHALELMHARGPQALTFAALARTSGLAPATLVQRFGSKAELLHGALLHAWDRLERRTAELGDAAAPTPAGAVAFLVGLSEQYGGIDNYADALLVLREDLLDPEVRTRGTAWHASLTTVLDGCLAGTPGAPPDIGEMVATYWQGSLLWWGFDPREPVVEHVERTLTRFLHSVLRLPTGDTGRA